MPVITSQRLRTTQPQGAVRINWANPFVKNLVWLHSPAALFNAVYTATKSPSFTGTVNNTKNSNGLAYAGTTGAGALYVTDVSATSIFGITDYPVTIAVIGIQPAASALGVVACITCDRFEYGSGKGHLYLDFESNNCYMYASSDVSFKGVVIAAQTPGLPFRAIASFRSATDREGGFYSNGVVTFASDTVSVLWQSGRDTFTTGYPVDGSPGIAQIANTAGTSETFVWKRGFLQVEMRQWLDNPWQMFAP